MYDSEGLSTHLSIHFAQTADKSFIKPLEMNLHPLLAIISNNSFVWLCRQVMNVIHTLFRCSRVFELGKCVLFLLYLVQSKYAKTQQQEIPSIGL